MKFLIIIMAILIPFVAFAEEPLRGVSVDDMKVIKISGKDKRAVIKTSERELKVIKVGDRIGENGKVIEITEGRVVIEEMTDRGTETVIIRVEDGKQRVERIRKVGEERPPLYAPQSTNPSTKGTKGHEEKK